MYSTTFPCCVVGVLLEWRPPCTPSPHMWKNLSGFLIAAAVVGEIPAGFALQHSQEPQVFWMQHDVSSSQTQKNEAAETFFWLWLICGVFQNRSYGYDKHYNLYVAQTSLESFYRNRHSELLYSDIADFLIVFFTLILCDMLLFVRISNRKENNPTVRLYLTYLKEERSRLRGLKWTASYWSGRTS